jgi:hypothetical protein
VVFFVFAPKVTQDVESRVQERRRSVRHPVVSQVAKIRLSSGREELCLLQDISAEGLQAEVYVSLGAGDHVDIELRTAHSAGGRVAWAVGKAIGVAFDAPIPAAAMLAHCSFDDSAGKLRPPRLRVNLRGLLRIDARTSAARISNISQAGLQIDAPVPLRPGAACTIVLPRLPARAASVCWWRDGCAGLMLDEPIDYRAFAEWRSALPAN